MAGIMVGSARHDENGHITGGKPGDQTGKEVATQPIYEHKLGWFIFRPKEIKVANAIASAMKEACANDNIGYNQNKRLGIVELVKIYKTIKKIKEKTNSDCSSLVRSCIYQATGIDVGNFTTDTEPAVLKKSGLFEEKKVYKSSKDVYNGDILVSQKKGHTVVVVSGRPRKDETKKTNVEIAKEVIAGKWGNGAERKDRLEKAGYVYSEIQNEVNVLLKGSNKTYAVVNTKTAKLNHREKALFGSKIIQRIEKGESVEVISKGALWTKCIYNGKTGYCYNSYLKF